MTATGKINWKQVYLTDTLGFPPGQKYMPLIAHDQNQDWWALTATTFISFNGNAIVLLTFNIAALTQLYQNRGRMFKKDADERIELMKIKLKRQREAENARNQDEMATPLDEGDLGKPSESQAQIEYEKGVLSN